MKLRPGFEQFVALRYLTGGVTATGSRFVRFIIYIAIAGVAVGVGSLLIALAITRGFSQEIERKIIDFGAHVQLENYLDAPLQNTADYLSQVRSIEKVEQAFPVIVELALVRTRRDIDGIALWGSNSLENIPDEYLVAGRRPDTSTGSSRPEILLSTRQSELLGVGPGDLVTCFSLREERRSDERGLLFGRPRVKQFEVSGLYDTGFTEVDDRFAFVNLESARSLFGYTRSEASRIDIYLQDVDDASALVSELEARFEFPAIARTVYEVHRNLFAWVDLQESIIPLIIAIIIVVASFNIVGTLLMLVLEKTREIGIVRSMGASVKSVRRTYLLLGVIIGVAGILLGEGATLVFALLQEKYGLISLPRETYYMDTAPVLLNGLDFLLVGAAALVLCVLAAWAPARVASKVDPIRTIRFST